MFAYGGGDNFLFIFTGESNSGGYAANASLTAGEAAARSEVQMFNVSTEVFEDLDIGTNNNLDHAGGLNSTTHGIENELANAVSAGRFTQTQVYVLQTGQGGDVIATWATDHASGYWTKFVARYTAAAAALASAGVSFTPVVFYSQGINDAIGYSIYGGGSGTPTPVADWKASTIAHLAKIRTLVGASTLIVMTKFRDATYQAFNDAIDEISALDAITPTIQTPDNTGVEWQGDGNHWAYVGYKNICQLFIDEVLAAGGQSSTPSISPASGQYSGDQSVTLTGGGTLKYSTTSADPHIGTVYSSAVTVTPPLTVSARATERGKKSSAIASVVYTGGDTWNTTDAAASSFTLTNGDLTVAATTGAWKSARATTGKSSGKLYFEIKCVESDTNAYYMLGVASSGFSAANYLGTSSYSAGLAPGTQYLSTGFSAGSGAAPSGNPTNNDVWQIAVDFTAGKLWLGKNNSWIASGDPAAGTNPAVNFTPATVGTLYPAISLYGSTSGTWTLQALASQQTHSAPSGFSEWG